MNSTFKRRALVTIKAERARRAEALEAWRKMALDCHRNGWRPSECIHGTSNWTDYDNVCQWCEEFGFNGFPSVYDYAIDRVRSAENLVLQRMEGAIKMRYWEMPDGLHNSVMDWAYAPLAELEG